MKARRTMWNIQAKREDGSIVEFAHMAYTKEEALEAKTNQVNRANAVVFNVKKSVIRH